MALVFLELLLLSFPSSLPFHLPLCLPFALPFQSPVNHYLFLSITFMLALASSFPLRSLCHFQQFLSAPLLTTVRTKNLLLYLKHQPSAMLPPIHPISRTFHARQHIVVPCSELQAPKPGSFSIKSGKFDNFISALLNSSSKCRTASSSACSCCTTAD